MKSLSEIDIQSVEGLRLRAILAGLSIRDLARLTGIKYDRLGRVLRRDLEPRASELQTITSVIAQHEADR